MPVRVRVLVPGAVRFAEAEALRVLEQCAEPGGAEGGDVDGDLGERSDSGFAIGFHPKFTYYVHSQNPVGKSNIEGLLVNYLRHKNSK